MRHLVAAVSVLVLALTVAPSAQAQGRGELLQQALAAYDDFDPPRAVRLARAALNPALGPLDSTWARGVHLLAQILIDEQQADLAATWARWAMRVNPDLSIDSVSFTPSVRDTLLSARAATIPTAGDVATQMTYAWPVAATTSDEARFRLGSAPAGVNVLVRGIGLVQPGAGLIVPAGTYELEVDAPGYLPLQVAREALPGVAVEMSFTLTPAAAAANTLTSAVWERVTRATIPLSITRFGAPQACAAGVAAGGERLVLTSYHAIRGADAIAANGEVRVGAWDAAANLAVLVLPAAAPDTLATTDVLTDGQALFGVALANCSTPSEVRVLLDSWEGRPVGALALSEAPTGAAIGTPLVDYEGRLGGVWSSGSRAAPASVIAPLIARARENVIAQNLLTPQAVAEAENHRYGSVIIAVDLPNATVRLTPLEAWHWEELAANGPAPFTFRGAAGRYRVEASAPNSPSRTQEIVIRAGETTRTAISLRAVAQGPAAAAEPRRGLPKWVWAAGVGGVAVAALALGGGGGGGGGGGSGGIDVSVPNPPVTP